jgi:hypothetical protein
MREDCKCSGASEARGSGAGERQHGEIPTGVGRRGGDDEANRQGPCGSDRGRRCRRWAAQTRRRDDFRQICQGRAGQDGPSTRARPAGERGVGLAGLRGRVGRLAAGPIGPNVKGKFFSEQNLIFDYGKALENCIRRFRRNFDMRIFPKFF